MEEEVLEEPRGSKPFLRRGAGWEARLAAAREGRRYVPRGGPVKDYSKEEEAPQVHRQRRSRPSSRIPQSPSKPAGGCGSSGTAKPSAGTGGYSTRRPAASSGAHSSATVPAARGLKSRRQQPGVAGRPSLQHGATRVPPSNTASISAAAPLATSSSSDWAKRLLGGQAPRTSQQAAEAQSHGGGAKKVHKDVALEEFEALESQVLREVGNYSPTHQPPRCTTPSPNKPTGSGGGGSSMVLQAGKGGAPATDVLAAAAAAVVTFGDDWPPVQPAGRPGHAGSGPPGCVIDDEGAHGSDIFRSDGEGNMHSLFGEDSQAEAAAAGIRHPLAQRRTVTFAAAHAAPAAAGATPAVPRPMWRAAPGGLPLPPVYREDDEYENEEAEMLAESSFVRERPPQPASNLVQQFFSRPAARPVGLLGKAAAPAAAPACTQPLQHPLQGQQQAGAAEHEAVEQLQQEVVCLQEERAKVARLRLELEEAAAKFEQEKVAFEKRRVEEAARFEAQRGEELRKLQRDRRVLEKQSRAILKMPAKQSKEEVQAVEALLQEERRSGRAREARHKLTVERLRQQIVELQERNGELRDQVQYLEQQRLQQSWGSGVGRGASGSTASTSGGTTAVSMTAVPAAPASGGGSGALGHASAAALDRGQQLSAGRRRQPAGVPVVKVERGSNSSSGGYISNGAAGDGSQVRAGPPGSTSVATGPAAAPIGASHPGRVGQQQADGHRQPGTWAVVNGGNGGGATCWGFGDEGGADAEDLGIADVQLSEEEVVVASEEEEHDAAGHMWSRGLPSDSSGSAAWPAAGASMGGQQQQLMAAEARLPAGPPSRLQEGPGFVAAPQAATADAMGKAASALERFNQLRQSLSHQEVMRGSLGGSHQCSGQGEAPSVAQQLPWSDGVMGGGNCGAGTGHIPPPAVMGAQDDLRRLGRSLLAASAAGAPHSMDGLEPLQQYEQCLPIQQQQPPPQPPLQHGQQGQHVLSPAAPGQPGDAVVSEVQHPDGRWERLYASGLREQCFLNGSTRQQLPSGASLTRFANSDIKKALPCGTVEYYYAEVSSWQVTHPSGVEVYFFSSGQVEAHHPGGIKEIVFPDGAVCKVLPDGRELVINAAHLSREIQQPEPVSALA